MGKCNYCGSIILFGGVKEGKLKFCNKECHEKENVLVLSSGIPNDVVEKQVRQIFHGLCPKCQGSGPVDVHISHRVYSALVFTSWSSNPQVSCRSCGRKSQIGSTFFSLALGWWGFPWGPIMTPVQIGKNIIGMVKWRDELKPSDQLENLVRTCIASQMMQEQQTTFLNRC